MATTDPLTRSETLLSSLILGVSAGADERASGRLA